MQKHIFQPGDRVAYRNGFGAQHVFTVLSCEYVDGDHLAYDLAVDGRDSGHYRSLQSKLVRA